MLRAVRRTRVSSDSNDGSRGTSHHSSASWWIEKPIMESPSYRETGEWSLGRVVWAPLASTEGRDVYRFIKDVQPGDVILHLDEERSFVGFSHAASSFNLIDDAPARVSQEPINCIRLRDYVRLSPPLSRDALIRPPYGERLKALIATGAKNLFYGSTLKFTGNYFTPAPPHLVAILDDAYERLAGRSLSDVIAGAPNESS